MTAASRNAVELFRRSYSGEPTGLFSAPGRVNLIGEHTDYSGGLVLPFAIDARAILAAAVNPAGVVRVVSAQRPGVLTSVALQDIHRRSPVARSWAGYLVGSIWALRAAGHQVGGLDLALDSKVPSGAGLSSSAAIECVTTLAASALFGLQVTAREIARLSQQAENDFVGVPCGPMDQTTSAVARAGNVLLFDTRAGTVEHIPFVPAAHGLEMLVVDTRVTHSLADGEYSRRRGDCERAAQILGVRWLRDIGPDELPAALDRLGDGLLRRRVRHVVTENDRVLRTAQRLRTGQVAGIGDLLTASHRSLAGDFEVSCPELDLAVDSALQAGAVGARMTGGGFGGSAVAMVPHDRVEAVIRFVTGAFDARGFSEPVCRIVRPAQGARAEPQA